MPGARGLLPGGDRARAGQEPHRVLGVDPQLEGVPGERHGVGVERDRPAGGDEQLLLDQVDAGHHLGDRVLHLQPGVHLEEDDLAGVDVEQALDRAGVAVADGLGRADRRPEQLRRAAAGVTAGDGVSSASFWLRRCTEQSRSPSATTRPSASPRTCTSTCRTRGKNRSTSTAGSPNIRSAKPRTRSSSVRSDVLVGGDRHAHAATAGGRLDHHREADVARRGDRLLRVAHRLGGAARDRARRRTRPGCARGSCRPSPRSPPATGRPRPARRPGPAGRSRRPRRGSRSPGGSPRRRTAGRPPAARRRPGSSAPAAAGPMPTASSASRTYGSRASASECTATARRPIRCTVRMMRRAISPRLATSTVSNTGGWPPRRKWVGRRD